MQGTFPAPEISFSLPNERLRRYEDFTESEFLNGDHMEQDNEQNE